MPCAADLTRSVFTTGFNEAEANAPRMPAQRGPVGVFKHTLQ